jgi:hypothetical protein
MKYKASKILKNAIQPESKQDEFATGGTVKGNEPINLINAGEAIRQTDTYIDIILQRRLRLINERNKQ